jgi:hypothetical protein
MTRKYPICPDRIRSIPEQFSWVDHRLARERHIELISHEAATLYLFLVTVADCQGLSYYADPTIRARLAMSEQVLTAARASLVRAGLVEYRSPLYQVLDLGPSRSREVPRASSTVGAPASIGEILRNLAGGAP